MRFAIAGGDKYYSSLAVSLAAVPLGRVLVNWLAIYVGRVLLPYTQAQFVPKQA